MARCGSEIGPALNAANGHGTKGYFTAVYQHCYKGACTWSGSFSLPDLGDLGAVARAAAQAPQGQAHRCLSPTSAVRHVARPQ